MRLKLKTSSGLCKFLGRPSLWSGRGLQSRLWRGWGDQIQLEQVFGADVQGTDRFVHSIVP